MASRARQKEHLRKVNAIIEMSKTGYYTAKEYSQKLGFDECLVRNIAKAHNVPLKKFERQYPNDTICWNCANYTKCSWHKTFTPVEGWVAEKTKIDIDGRPIESYCVKSCPMFKKGR